MEVKRIDKSDGSVAIIDFDQAVNDLYNSRAWKGDRYDISKMLIETGFLWSPFFEYRIVTSP